MAEPLNKTDYGNLLNLVARATFNGIQESATGVALFSKLQALANEPDANALPEPPKVGRPKKVTEGKDGNDSKGSA